MLEWARKQIAEQDKSIRLAHRSFCVGGIKVYPPYFRFIGTIPTIMMMTTMQDTKKTKIESIYQLTQKATDLN